MDQDNNRPHFVDTDLTNLPPKQVVKSEPRIKSVCEFTTDLISVQDPVASGEIYEGAIWSIESVISSIFHSIAAALGHLPGH